MVIIIKKHKNQESRLQEVSKLLELGVHLKVSKNTFYSSPTKAIKTIEQAVEFEKECVNKDSISYNLNLNPNEEYPQGLVCIDIDNGWVWKQIDEMERKGYLQDVILNPLKRGGHIVELRRFLIISASVQLRFSQSSQTSISVPIKSIRL